MKQKLVLTAVDDEVTISLSVVRYQYIGGIEIGPTSVADVGRLSEHNPDLSEWMRSVAEQFREIL